MKRFLAVYLLALTVLVQAVAPGCGGEVSDEDRVWAAVQDMAEAAEQKDVGRLKGHISKSYSDPAGNDYDALKGFIAYHFLRSGDISVFLRRHKVELRADRAYVTSRAVISRGRKVSDVAQAAPGSTGGFVLDFEFVRDGSDWLLVSAIWRQVPIAEAL